jgi:hypothetical protein
VISGEPVAPETVPWFAEVGACGGTLIAPNRVVTAAHCVAHRSLGANELAFVVVAGEAHHAARFAMHPGWRHARITSATAGASIQVLSARGALRPRRVSAAAQIRKSGGPRVEARAGDCRFRREAAVSTCAPPRRISR